MFENSSDINKHSPIRKRSFLHSSEDTGEREVSLFSHLNSPNIFNEELIHWAVREYGLKVKERKIQGGN